MLKLSDARTFRRTAAAVALVVGPVLLLVSGLITTYGGDDTAEYIAEVAGRRGAEEASAVLAILGFALLIPGIVGALALLRVRGVALGHVGAVLAVLGLACFPALVSSSFYDVAATAPGAPTAAWVDISDRLDDRAGAIVIVAVALIGTVVGFLVLAAAFLRARTVPLAAPILIIAGAILIVFSGDSRLLNVLANLLLLGGWGTVAWTLLQQPDDRWAQPEAAAARPTREGAH